MRILAFLFLLLIGAGPAAAAGLQTEDLSIITGSGQSHHFTVEVARSVDEQAKGLMFREHMGPDAGMIFPYERPATVVFWMKNTLIPLDMLFVAADGRISHIVENAVPKSLATIPSGGPVKAVVEVNGGTASRLGIHVGDKVQSPELGQGK